VERGVLGAGGSGKEEFGEKAREAIRGYFEESEGSGREEMFSVLALVREGSG
jgi:hypothetical protein